jgi:hypothetical protein
MKELKQFFEGDYSDREYYVGIKELVMEGFINKRYVAGRSYYWIKRD